MWVDAGGARGGGRGVVLIFMLHIWLGFACAMRPVSTGKESGRTVFYRCRLEKKRLENVPFTLKIFMDKSLDNKTVAVI